jgi:hypothetical protein
MIVGSGRRWRLSTSPRMIASRSRAHSANGELVVAMNSSSPSPGSSTTPASVPGSRSISAVPPLARTTR